MKEIFSKIKNEGIVKQLLQLAKERNRKIYLVGGYIRDAILGRMEDKIDLDFAIDSDAPSVAKEFAKQIGASYVLLDEVHNIARVVYCAGDKNYELDFADFRAEFLEGDLRLRDFTISAIALDLETLQLIDPVNGREDLKRKLIRAASDSAFIDDPGRIVRAFSLAAELGFELESHTEELITDSIGRVCDVSAERTRDEFLKILQAKNSEKFIRVLDKFGILELIIPEIKPMKNCAQGPYHHLDIWQHTLEALKQADILLAKTSFIKNEAELCIIKLAALLHDIGKPPAKIVDDEGKIKFIGHEKIGAEMAEKICQRLRLSAKETDSVKRLTLHHLRPGYLADNDEVTKRAIFRIFRDAGDDGVGVFLLSLADKFATRGPLTTEENVDRHERFILETLKDYLNKPAEVAKPPKLITGNDLMKELKLPAGPKIGELLREIQEAQVEGEVKTKEQALKFIKKAFLKKR
ncbi:MAG: HD domain-containing protein [Candidatus Omnitrophota bacterium]